MAPRCSESGKISSEYAVTRAEPVLGFCGALVLSPSADGPKRLVADLTLDKTMLQEVLSEKY